MAFATIIIGVILMIGGISCIFTPVESLLSLGYFLGILFLVYGVGGLIRAFQKRAFAFEIVLSILAIILGVISIMRPGSTLAFDHIILVIVALWFIVQGIVNVTIALKAKGITFKWFLALLMGIASIVLGVYSLLHPMVGAMAVGYLLGFYFIETGLNLIIMGTTVQSIKDDLNSF